MCKIDSWYVAKSILRSLGKEVRERRNELSLSQEALAQKAGVHLNTLGKLERGTYNPTILLLQAIAKPLNVALEELVLAAAKRGD